MDINSYPISANCGYKDRSDIHWSGYAAVYLLPSPSILVALYQDPPKHRTAHLFECSCFPGYSLCGPDNPGNFGVTRIENIVPSALASYREEESLDPSLDRESRVYIYHRGWSCRSVSIRSHVTSMFTPSALV